MTPRSSSAGPSSGAALFARYADAPNALGYCGPPEGIGTTEPDDPSTLPNRTDA